MDAPELTSLVASLADSLAALTANQAMIIELLNDKLPDLSAVEAATVEKCANNNYAIAEALQNVINQLRTS